MTGTWRAVLVSALLTTHGVAAQDGAGQKSEPREGERVPTLFWDEGLWYRARRGGLVVKFGGQLQGDAAAFAGSDTPPVDLENDVEWRRARAYASGSFLRRWQFKFQWDFAGGRSSNLTDAWIDFGFELWRKKLRFRSGRFSSTFGLENDVSSNDTLFMEQGLTAAFVPPQETGVLLHSESNRRRWDFSFSSSAREFECLLCSVTGVTGRYSTSFTFGRPDRRLHLGANYSRRWTDQATSFSQRPESHIAPRFVDTSAIVSDRVDVALIEFAYVRGPASIQSEYGVTRVKRPVDGAPVFHAVDLTVSRSLTGEMRPYRESSGVFGRIRPRRSLGDGIGAIEVAVRISYIDLDDEDVDGGRLADLSFAVNWYPTHPTRVSVNVVRAEREAWGPVWILQMRLQLAL